MTVTDGSVEPPSTPAVDPAAVALEAERDFLLRSLADLESERAAGELTEDRHRELHDRYTVQAATVLRALDRLEHAPTPVKARRRGRRAAVAAIAVAAVAAGGGALLLDAAGERQPGQTITGNAQSGPTGLDSLARAARQRPDDPAAQFAYASALMGEDRLVDALKAFDTAARLDPANPAPHAYGGWIVFLAGLTDDAMTRLDAAVAADPEYPDARFFRGMVLFRGRQDEAAALTELREYLRLAPNGPERQQVQDLVDRLGSPTTPGAP